MVPVVAKVNGVAAGAEMNLEAEGLAQTVNFATSDTREAVQAFLDKRPPVFHGR
jgi:1,4-dihydroxy-2-naphthoyl-CoA synthase